MMTRELFKKRMELIMNFQSEQDTLNVLVSKICDGHTVAVIGTYLMDELLNMIAEDFERTDGNDLLSWWLYEEDNRVIFYGEYGEKEISVKTLDELYDYMVRCIEENKKDGESI